ncbi:nucleotidyl transferase AbiEii/AbiGii toxin family protein [Myxococcota bacterium]|nr:nucleotidyl transferase AbiEii/AbiGii toxin family protein [Myxococcota bacterium]
MTDDRKFPKTFVDHDDPPGVARTQVFDPALKQFENAFRRGDPMIRDWTVASAWRRARRRALDQALRATVTAPVGEHLVFRGSAVLPAWLGDAAREPRDLDAVVVPSSQPAEGPATTSMMRAIVDAVTRAPTEHGITFDASLVRTDEIWTYDRVPGRRIVFPWSVVGLPSGLVQLDLVFGEELHDPPEETDIPTSDGALVRARTASMRLSLAWKLLWLATDAYPQAKDVFDATLLAERTTVPFDLLRRVFAQAGPELGRDCAPLRDRLLGLDERVEEAEWGHLGASGSLSHPREGWGARLWATLEPNLTE